MRLYNHVIAALRGRREWIQLRNEYDIKDGTLVLFMPENNEKINYYALKHLKNYMESKYMERAVIATDQHYVREQFVNIKSQTFEFAWLETKQCRDLLKYYQLQYFFENFIVVSIYQPSGNTVGNMLKSLQITEEELLLGSIFI